MKYLKTLIIFLAALIISTACNKKDEVYSCNDDVNNWIYENIKVLANLNREQLATLPLVYQRAAFRSFTPSKKCEIWLEKLDLVMEQEWNEAELKLIKDFKQKMTPETYYHENMKETQAFFKQWGEEFFSLGGDSVRIIVCFAHIATLEEIYDLVHNAESLDYSWLEGNFELKVEPAPPPVYGNDCDCEWDITCSLISMGNCDNSMCDDTQTGCGFGWNSPCEKVCTDDL